MPDKFRSLCTERSRENFIYQSSICNMLVYVIYIGLCRLIFLKFFATILSGYRNFIVCFVLRNMFVNEP